jgi:hypothetical protein
VILAICCLVVAGLRVRHSCGISAAASPKKATAAAVKAPKATAAAVKAPSTAPQGSVASTEVVKYCDTQQAARELAVDQARIWVGDFLSRQDPPVDWRPDNEYVAKNLIKDSKEEVIQLGEEGKKEDFQQVTLTVEVSQKTLDDMRSHDREYHDLKRKEISGSRQVLLAKILAGLVAGLIALAAYLRLDEATKGYYKTWLRLGSLALVATVGAGVWLLW